MRAGGWSASVLPAACTLTGDQAMLQQGSVDQGGPSSHGLARYELAVLHVHSLVPRPVSQHCGAICPCQSSQSSPCWPSFAGSKAAISAQRGPSSQHLCLSCCKHDEEEVRRISDLSSSRGPDGGLTARPSGQQLQTQCSFQPGRHSLLLCRLAQDRSAGHKLAGLKLMSCSYPPQLRAAARDRDHSKAAVGQRQHRATALSDHQSEQHGWPPPALFIIKRHKANHRLLSPPDACCRRNNGRSKHGRGLVRPCSPALCAAAKLAVSSSDLLLPRRSSGSGARARACSCPRTRPSSASSCATSSTSPL